MRKLCLLVSLLIFANISFGQFRVDGYWSSDGVSWSTTWARVLDFDINGDNHSKIFKAVDNWLQFKINNGVTYYGGVASSGTGNVTYYGNGDVAGGATNIYISLVKDSYYLFTFHNNSSSSYYWTIEKINSMSCWYRNITDNGADQYVSLTQVSSVPSNWFLNGISIISGKKYQFAFLPNSSWNNNNNNPNTFNVAIVDFWKNSGSGYHANGQDHKIEIASTSGSTYNVAVKIDTKQYEVTTSDLTLPVELTSFAAKTDTKGIVLNWNTATEVSNLGFDVERSLDKTNWQKIAFVNGSGNSNSPKNYSYRDDYSVQGSCYYRLRQIDTDGKFEYSKVIEVKGIGAKSFTLEQNYPNPFNPNTKITFTVNESGKAKLIVYDVLGKERAVLFSGNVETGKSYNVNFNGANMESGVYFYKLTTGSITSIKKMILIK